MGVSGIGDVVFDGIGDATSSTGTGTGGDVLTGVTDGVIVGNSAMTDLTCDDNGINAVVGINDDGNDGTNDDGNDGINDDGNDGIDGIDNDGNDGTNDDGNDGIDGTNDDGIDGTNDDGNDGIDGIDNDGNDGTNDEIGDNAVVCGNKDAGVGKSEGIDSPCSIPNLTAFGIAIWACRILSLTRC